MIMFHNIDRIMILLLVLNNTFLESVCDMFSRFWLEFSSSISKVIKSKCYFNYIILHIKYYFP